MGFVYYKIMLLKSRCENCNEKFEYNNNHKTGKYCSNKCRGEYIVKKQFINGTVFSKAMRKYANVILGDNCFICKQGRLWNGKELVLQVDHINGIKTDNRFSNLRLVCPNCHTQTSTWGSSNISEIGRLKLKTKK